MKVTYWTIIYSHRHGTDAWTMFAHECEDPERGPTEEEITNSLGDMWEPDKEDEWIEIIGRQEQDIPDVTDDGEIWYCWRVLKTVEGDEKPRLLVPWSDPHMYEFAFDFIYETPSKAVDGLETMGAKDDAEEEGWLLCRMTLNTVTAPTSPSDENE